MDKITLTIDGQIVKVNPGTTVMQACQQLDIEVPHFCYHERLDIAGNCRMCLVEMENAPKPIASCAMPAAEGMVIRTDTPSVEKARNGVMEFLLLNHPLDCPICDQGGECDLQDQAMAYGIDKARTLEMRRSVKDKYMGPLVKTIMTRCIHCTRCIRFIEDVAGVPELGAVNRGEDMEVTTYVEKALTSEMSANIIDLCPVGALTSKPYAFKARPWELKKTESIDVMDAVGCNIRVDSRGNEVMRVMPRLNEEINEEWISDKTRYAYDGLLRQRLDQPYIRQDGKLVPASWEDAFGAITKATTKMTGKRMAALVGDMCDAESMYALKQLMKKWGSPNLDCNTDGMYAEAGNRGSYQFNTTIAGIEQADACLIVGSNPRLEAPLVMARLRKRFIRGGFHVAMVGEQVDLNLKYEHLSDDVKTLEAILAGKHAYSKVLKTAEKPMLILGTGALTRPDAAAILNLCYEIANKYDLFQKGWNGFNVLHRHASRMAALDMDFTPQKIRQEMGMNTDEILTAVEAGKVKFVYLLGEDSINMNRLEKAFVVYQGHHGDAGAQAADVVLPGAAFTEKDGMYINTEGRLQYGFPAIFPVGQAKEDWSIIRALSEKVGKKLAFDSLAELRKKLAKDYPVFGAFDQVKAIKPRKAGIKGKLDKARLTSPIKNFYMTNVIARNSKTMADCAKEFHLDQKPNLKVAAE